MTNEDIKTALLSTAEAINTLSIAVNDMAQKNFTMRAELEALRVITQAFIATFQCEPTLASELLIKLKSAVEAERIVALNSSTSDQLHLAREVWIKALVPSDMHINVF